MTRTYIDHLRDGRCAACGSGFIQAAFVYIGPVLSLGISRVEPALQRTCGTCGHKVSFPLYSEVDPETFQKKEGA